MSKKKNLTKPDIKITYEQADISPEEAERRLAKVFAIVFEEVLKIRRERNEKI